MADAITARVVANTKTHYVVHLTNISDATGESAAIKADKSTLLDANGLIEPVALDIEAVRWNIQGFTYIKILWDHTTDDTALVLAGSGYDDFAGAQGIDGCVKDPRSAGDTGDILLTTVGSASGNTYDITLTLRKSIA